MKDISLRLYHIVYKNKTTPKDGLICRLNCFPLTISKAVEQIEVRLTLLEHKLGYQCF